MPRVLPRRHDASPASSSTSLDLPGPLPRGLPWLLLVAGVLGLLAAAVLTVEKHALDADPTYEPSCSINPVLSCGSVMATPQASVFGFPNSVIGVVGFAVVALTGGVLLAGARLPRWYWAGLGVGVLFGAVFVHWLIAQSLYRIGALCPYCMLVWAVTIPAFWYVTLRNLHAAASRLPGPLQRATHAAGRAHGIVLTLWFLAVVVLILQRFWDFWVAAVPA